MIFVAIATEFSASPDDVSLRSTGQQQRDGPAGWVPLPIPVLAGFTTRFAGFIGFRWKCIRAIRILRLRVTVLCVAANR